MGDPALPPGVAECGCRGDDVASPHGLYLAALDAALLQPPAQLVAVGLPIHDYRERLVPALDEP